MYMHNQTTSSVTASPTAPGNQHHLVSINPSHPSPAIQSIFDPPQSTREYDYKIKEVEEENVRPTGIAG